MLVLMHCSFEETAEIVVEAAAIGEQDDCHGIAGDVMFAQLAPMGTGTFDVALDIDMLKDAIVDNWLPVQNILAAHADGGMTPGEVSSGEDPVNFPFFGYQTESRVLECRKHVARCPQVQPEFSQHVLAYISSCPSVSMLFTYVPFVLTDVTFLQYGNHQLVHPSALHPIGIHLPQLLHGPSLCSSCENDSVISKILAHITGVTLLAQIFHSSSCETDSVISKILAHITGVTLLAQIFHSSSCENDSVISKILARITGVTLLAQIP
ncbi:hypothetical protein EDC04DRAFT_2894850 [Pisolithus marmoratus]|nr:hypothetical protein EDC04DRAFT_2894850 [Pisolithus marmoratus]